MVAYNHDSFVMVSLESISLHLHLHTFVLIYILTKQITSHYKGFLILNFQSFSTLFRRLLKGSPYDWLWLKNSWRLKTQFGPGSRWYLFAKNDALHVRIVLPPLPPSMTPLHACHISISCQVGIFMYDGAHLDQYDVIFFEICNLEFGLYYLQIYFGEL